MGSIEEQTKRLVKLAVILMYIKDYDAAELALLGALSNTNDFGEATEAAALLPRIYHRMAQLEALRGHWESANNLFEHAEGSFDRNNVVGRARTIRTRAWLTYRHGDPNAGLSLARRARAVLQRTTETDPVWEKEYIVTRGVVARVDESLSNDELAERLLAVDETLRGGNDPIYERDNLAGLMTCVPLGDRIAFQVRYRAIGVRLVANQELNYVLRDLGDGNVRGVLFGPTGRTVRRLLNR